MAEKFISADKLYATCGFYFIQVCTVYPTFLSLKRPSTFYKMQYYAKTHRRSCPAYELVLCGPSGLGR